MPLELSVSIPTSDGRARELPHHQLQWLEIAMVLAGGPDILLLDEPTAGMSPDETRRRRECSSTSMRTGLTIVVVEHDMAFVREVAQQVTVLHQGRVFAEGTIDEITAHEDVRRDLSGAGLTMTADPCVEDLRCRLCHGRRAAGRRASTVGAGRGRRRARAATASARAR